MIGSTKIVNQSHAHEMLIIKYNCFPDKSVMTIVW